MSGCHGDWPGSPCGVIWLYSRPMRSRRYSYSTAGSHGSVGSNRETGNLLPRRMGCAITTSPPLLDRRLRMSGWPAPTFLAYRHIAHLSSPVTRQYAYDRAGGRSGGQPPGAFAPEDNEG